MEIKNARSALLPEGVTIREWCVRRVVMSQFGNCFEALPPDRFLRWEEDLRTALISTVNKHDRQLLSKVVAHPKTTSIARK